MGPITGLIGPVADIAFRRSGEKLFAYDANSSDHTLYTLNLATGAATLVGSTGLRSNGGNGIAFSLEDTLFHSNRDFLHTLNQVTGVATRVGPVSYPALGGSPRANSMAYHPATHVPYISIPTDGGPSYLGVMNTTTGAVTIIGTPVTGLDALAFGN